MFVSSYSLAASFYIWEYILVSFTAIDATV